MGRSFSPLPPDICSLAPIASRRFSNPKPGVAPIEAAGDSVWAQNKGIRDLRVGFSCSQQVNDFPLTRRQNRLADGTRGRPTYAPFTQLTLHRRMPPKAWIEAKPSRAFAMCRRHCRHCCGNSRRVGTRNAERIGDSTAGGGKWGHRPTWNARLAVRDQASSQSTARTTRDERSVSRHR